MFLARKLGAIPLVVLILASGCTESEPAAPAATPEDPQVTESLGVLNPNLASQEDLAALEGLNEDLVGRILEERPFLSMKAFDDLLRPLLAEDRLADLYEMCFVQLDLNSASREEILLVPGVGERMAHEFEEYRPYVALSQFRQEIGKYVDADEVARLERYVFVPIDLNAATDEEILRIPGVGDRMLREFKEYRPYTSIERFRKEIGKYVDSDELARLERYVRLQ